MAALLIVAASAAAQVAGNEPPAPPAEPAAGGGFFERAKSWFKPVDTSQDAKAVENGGPSGGPPAPEAGATGRNPSKVKDITEVDSISAKAFDPTCKTLVEPFGLTDNMLSLGVLVAKLKANDLVISLGGSGTHMDLPQTVRMAGKNLNWLPMDAEHLLGERLHQDAADNLLDPARKGNAAIIANAQAMLERIVAQIKEPTPYQFQIFVRKGSGNAQALPGGYIHIDRDLVVNSKSADRANFALAHELAHVLQRHETRATQARLTDGVDSFDGLRKILASATGNPAAVLTYSNGLMERFVTFSQDQELQADACAIRLLDGLYPDKKQLAKVVQSFKDSLGPPLRAEAVDTNQLLVFVSHVEKMGKLDDQHPNTVMRAKNLDQMMLEIRKPKTATADAAPLVVKTRKN